MAAEAWAADAAVDPAAGVVAADALPGGETPAIGMLREHLEQRLHLLPRYSQKLGAPRTGGLAWPCWERDPRFELGAHVRHATLPSPGDEHEFLDWISDFYSHRLDRSRPLWEIVLLDGPADGHWALVWKTHHCLVDGVGSVGIVDLLLDSEPPPHESTARQAAPALISDGALHGRLPHRLEPVGQAAGAGIAAARAGAHALIHPRATLERSREVLICSSVKS